MRTSSAMFLALATLLSSTDALAQQEGRFDAQVFRPSAAPRDLVTVQKSEVIGHLSPTVGVFMDMGFDPLVFVSKDTNQTVDAVAARLQLTGLAGVGLFDWADVRLAVPFVAYQGGDNLRQLGTEGSVETQSVGDLRVTGRVQIPGLNRRQNPYRGLGMALVANVNLPTGDPLAFTGDGVLTGGVTLVADYRIPARNHHGQCRCLAASRAPGHRWLAGRQYGLVWHRRRELCHSEPGDLGPRWRLRLSLAEQVSRQCAQYSRRGAPGAALADQERHHLDFWWQLWRRLRFRRPGISPVQRYHLATPAFRASRRRINRILEDDTNDPDRDGLNSEVDRCPEVPGPVKNEGCPEGDKDNDKIVDTDDACPDIPGVPEHDGCPPAYIKDDQIVILGKVHFATDEDIILDVSKPILEAVAGVLEANPDIQLVQVEGHTDIRHSHAYNMALSQRRANSVMKFLIDQGIDRRRLEAVGYGHTKPLYDDTGCIGPDELLSEECRFMTSKNRRVIFRILQRSGAPNAQSPGAGLPVQQ